VVGGVGIMKVKKIDRSEEKALIESGCLKKYIINNPAWVG